MAERMARRDPTPEVGDRFTRVGMFSKDFEIIEIYERHGHPPHARLVGIDDSQDAITLALSVLLDRNFYKPAERRPKPAAWSAPRVPSSQPNREIMAVIEEPAPSVPDLRHGGPQTGDGRKGGLSRLFGRKRGLSPV